MKLITCWSVAWLRASALETVTRLSVALLGSSSSPTSATATLNLLRTRSRTRRTTARLSFSEADSNIVSSRRSVQMTAGMCG